MPEPGGRRGSCSRCPLPGGARGAKVPFQFNGLLWRYSKIVRNVSAILLRICFRKHKKCEVQLPMFCKHLLVYINSKVPFHENLPPPLAFTSFRRLTTCQFGPSETGWNDGFFSGLVCHLPHRS
jgi:hypothetical protein